MVFAAGVASAAGVVAEGPGALADLNEARIFVSFEIQMSIYTRGIFIFSLEIAHTKIRPEQVQSPQASSFWSV